MLKSYKIISVILFTSVLSLNTSVYASEVIDNENKENTLQKKINFTPYNDLLEKFKDSRDEENRFLEKIKSYGFEEINAAFFVRDDLWGQLSPSKEIMDYLIESYTDRGKKDLRAATTIALFGEKYLDTKLRKLLEFTLSQDTKFYDEEERLKFYAARLRLKIFDYFDAIDPNPKKMLEALHGFIKNTEKYEDLNLYAHFLFSSFVVQQGNGIKLNQKDIMNAAYSLKKLVNHGNYQSAFNLGCHMFRYMVNEKCKKFLGNELIKDPKHYALVMLKMGLQFSPTKENFEYARNSTKGSFDYYKEGKELFLSKKILNMSFNDLGKL